MLTSLSSTFIFHFDTKADAQFTEDHRAIQSAAKALEQLLPCAAVKPLSSPDASTSNSFFGRKKGGMSQKQMKKARRVENITLPPIDQALYLNTLLVDPPEELDDVPRVIQHILTAQKEILDVRIEECVPLLGADGAVLRRVICRTCVVRKPLPFLGTNPSIFLR